MAASNSALRYVAANWMVTPFARFRPMDTILYGRYLRQFLHDYYYVTSRSTVSHLVCTPRLHHPIAADWIMIPLSRFRPMESILLDHISANSYTIITMLHPMAPFLTWFSPHMQCVAADWMVIPFSRSKSMESILAPTPSLPRTWSRGRGGAAVRRRTKHIAQRRHSAPEPQGYTQAMPCAQQAGETAGGAARRTGGPDPVSSRDGAESADLVYFVDAAGVEQDALRQRCLAAVYVCRDADVSQPGEGLWQKAGSVSSGRRGGGG